MEVRFTITKQRMLMAALFVLAGVGLGSLLSPLIGTALATVGNTVNISDHSSSAYFAKVDSSGALKTTAAVTGKVAPVPPASPWRASFLINQIADPGYPIAGPSSTAINITSVTFSTAAPSGSGPEVALIGRHVPNSATNCSGSTLGSILWHSINAGGPTTPLTASFPTPLQWKPPANRKACLFALAPSGYPTVVSASGFYS